MGGVLHLVGPPAHEGHVSRPVLRVHSSGPPLPIKGRKNPPPPRHRGVLEDTRGGSERGGGLAERKERKRGGGGPGEVPLVEAEGLVAEEGVDVRRLGRCPLRLVHLTDGEGDGDGKGEGEGGNEPNGEGPGATGAPLQVPGRGHTNGRLVV